jgi:hypothetical protein
LSLRFLFLPASEIGPYVDGLRAIERATEYPIADGADAFTIDHGDDYASFFTMLGHDARFVLALDGDRVVGGVAGVARNVRVRGRMVPALYGADWKVARELRGQRAGRDMMKWAFGLIYRHPELFTWRLGYVAAMRGQRGDVMRATRGVHPARLTGKLGALDVYFVPAAKLASLSLAAPPPPPDPDQGVDLSFVTTGSVDAPGLVSTAGRKDLRLRSTGQPWSLVHLPYGPARWRPSWGHYLKTCGEALVSRSPGAIGCFALDQRLVSHIAWLSSLGIDRGAVCSVYALDLTLQARRASWIHLATSEI